MLTFIPSDSNAKLLAYGENKNGKNFKLYFEDHDGDPQIKADAFSLFDKLEIHEFLDNYSLS